MKKTSLLFLFAFLGVFLCIQNSTFAQCLSTTITATGGLTEVNTCPGDGQPDIVRFRPNTFGTLYLFVVTDTSNIIISSFFGSAANFEDAGEGVCRVWGVSFSGVVSVPIGEDATTAQFSDFCSTLSSNFVTVIRGGGDNATIQTTDGLTSVEICPGDGQADVVEFETTSDAEQHIFIITDEDNVIIGLPNGNSQDFDGAGSGICRVWGFAGEFMGMIGDDLDDFPSSCGAGLSSNFITIDRNGVEGGTVATADGSSEVTVCPGDGMPDVVDFSSEGASQDADFTYVVTDENGVILGIPDGSSQDFEGAGTGTCLVWGLSYEGDLLAMVGDTATSAVLASSCFDLSDNFITVSRTSVEGGTIAIEGGGTETITCVGDGIPDIVTFTGSGASADANFTYVVTDENGVILGIPDGNSQDFEGAGQGTCLVWGLSYTDSLLAEAGDTLASVELATGCFDLSDNFISVLRTGVEGGTIATDSGESEVMTCPSDGIPDVIVFASSGASTEANFTYIITDDNGVVLGIPDGDSQDFDGAGSGICVVWGLSYTDELLVEAGDTLNAGPLASGCFDLSDNAVIVNRTGVEGGTVATTDGETSVSICPGDGVADVVTFSSEDATSDANFTYIITDADGVILGIPEGDNQDFDGAGTGLCLVWGLSYTGSLLAEAGDTATVATLATGCFALSDNSITVDRTGVDGGSIAINDGTTEIMTCPGDGIPDVVTFTGSGASATANFTYIITDDNGVVLGVPEGDSQDFDGAGSGTCLVWGLSYTDSLLVQMGDTLSAVTLATGCFDLSDNSITVNRTGVEGGTVATTDGENEVVICPGDGIADIVEFSSDGATANADFAYVITDENGVILGIPDGNSQDFDGAGIGTCLVWGLSYTGELLAEAGDTATVATLAEGCFDLSDNFITVIRTDVNGGIITDENGAFDVTVCPGDGIADVVVFSGSGASADANFTFVITDENGIVLGIPEGNSQDFDGAGSGICLVWGLSYTDSLLLQGGDTLLVADLSTGCSALSENFLTVNRPGVEGGVIRLSDGSDIAYVCPDDGVADVLQFTNGEASGDNFTYVITDADGVILGLPDGDTQDFEGAGVGTCLVYGAAYSGMLTLNAGDTLSNTPVSDACYDLSDNFVTVVRASAEAGMVMTVDSLTEVTTCAGDGFADVISFMSEGASDASFTYIITDDNGVVLGIPAGSSQDFEGAGGGNCRVYGLSFTGTLTLMAGDTLGDMALSDGCYDLSDNFITVIRESLTGGTVEADNGLTTLYTCPSDGLEDIIVFTGTGASADANFTYIVTNSDNHILGIPDGDSQDFEGAGEGVCYVYGLAYQGNLTAMPGDSIGGAALADGCFGLSENFITVNRAIPDGGLVATTDDSTTVDICVGDGLADVIEFAASDASNSLYRYIITDENNVILGLPMNNSQDFEGAGEGVCLVWGLAYTGAMLAEVGDTIDMDLLITDGCFDLSDNFITVNRIGVDGGVVGTVDGEDELTILVGDGEPDVVHFANSGSAGTGYAYIVTDTLGVIVGLPAADSLDFDGAGEGVCLVYGVAYTGNLTAMVGDTLGVQALSDACFALSSDFITINRNTPLSNIGEVDRSPFDKDKAAIADLKAQPNPVQERLQVRFRSIQQQEVTLSTYNFSGQLVQQQKLKALEGWNQTIVDVNELVSGMYLIRIDNGKEQLVVKVMKE